MTLPTNRRHLVLAPAAALIALAFAALTDGAHAQPTAEQQSVIRSNCRSDFMSKCSGVTPGGKDAILADLLLGISEHLLAGGRAQVSAAADADRALSALVSFHLDFTLTAPDLIRVQDRDLANLGGEARRVRRLQRAYVEVWRGALQEARGDLDDRAARARVQAVFGLLNSTPHSAVGSDPDAMREMLSAMAAAALAA